ncbi:hypothetical protein HYY71_01520 [Candidatus Woesearchaeota archaeon]|nr:hypothetical protein [Candidatus Woesearchaeota archaeon]
MVGNIPNFTKIDVLRCFLRFNKNTGRQELARELELGEGTIRTILEIMKSKKLLDSTKKGHFLSKKGAEILDTIYGQISMPKSITTQTIYSGFKKVGVLVRNVSNLKELYKLRDIAVKSGAEGAIILRFDKRLYAPESDYEQDYGELEKHFEFKDNDVLVVAFSSKNRQAENGSLAIAIELSEELKRFMDEI